MTAIETARRRPIRTSILAIVAIFAELLAPALTGEHAAGADDHAGQTAQADGHSGHGLRHRT